MQQRKATTEFISTRCVIGRCNYLKSKKELVAFAARRHGEKAI